MNDRAIRAGRRGDADPIAYGRKVGSAVGLVAEAPADLRPAVEFTRDTIQPALLLNDSRDLKLLALVINLCVKERRPTEAFQ